MTTSAQLKAALWAEAQKLVSSRVVYTATLLLVGGIALLASTLHLAAGAGNEKVLMQLGPLAKTDAWARLLGVTSQIKAAGGLLGFGVVLSWSVGREFSDGTISGLFGLPVRRSVIAAAKLLVFLIWTLVVAALLVLLLLLVGLILRIGPIDAPIILALARLFGLAVLSGLLAYPAAWVSTLGRGLLPGIATTVALVVLTQVAVVAGSGAWFPVAAPALWAMEPEAASGLQLALVGLVPFIFGGLTLVAWHRLELDR